MDDLSVDVVFTSPPYNDSGRTDRDVETKRHIKYQNIEYRDDWFEWERDGKDIPKIHPAQKPVKVLKRLIEIFTDPGDVVIDPCFGSGSTARACIETGRNFYGFEINKEFYRRAKEEMIVLPNDGQMSIEDFIV